MRSATQVSHSGLGLGPSTWIYALRAHGGSAQLAASASDSTVRLFTPELSPSATIATPHGTVTALCTGAGLPHLYTAGADGSICAWDPRAPTRPAFAHPNGSRGAISSLALAAPPSAAGPPSDGGPPSAAPLVAAGTELTNHAAVVSVYDARQPAHPLLVVDEAHNDDVTVLRWSEAAGGATYLLSGGMDGLLSVLDVREQPDDALVKVLNVGASVAHAGFVHTGPARDGVYAVSHDERLKVWSVPVRDGEAARGKGRFVDGEDGEDAEDEEMDYGDVRPKLDCEYVVGVLACGAESVVGVGKHSEARMELLPLRAEGKGGVGDGLEGVREEQGIRLPGAHGEELVRDFLVDAPSGVVFTGGEDGQVRCWKVQAEPAEEEEVRSGPVRGKGRKEGGKAKLFKPY